jgi:hypothetical protein
MTQDSSQQSPSLDTLGLPAITDIGYISSGLSSEASIRRCDMSFINVTEMLRASKIGMTYGRLT